MSEILDCRGLACPEPVLQAKRALEEIAEGTLAVLVDTAASRDNVRRFAESQGCSTDVSNNSDGTWQVDIIKGYGCTVMSPNDAPAPSASPQALPAAFLITSDRIGPEPELGAILMRAFLNTLAEAEQRPARLLFLNRGVLLTVEGAETLEVLGELERAGTEVLSCGTCLEFLGQRDALQVGVVSNMYTTVETLTEGFRVVTVN